MDEKADIVPPLSERLLQPLIKIFLVFQVIGAGYGFSAAGCPFVIALALALFIGWIPVLGTGFSIYGAVKEWDFPAWGATSVFLVPAAILVWMIVASWPLGKAIAANVKPDISEASVVSRALLWARAVPAFIGVELISIGLGWVIVFGMVEEMASFVWLELTGKSAPAMAVEAYEYQDEESHRHSVRVKFKTDDGVKVDTSTGGKGALPEDTDYVLKHHPDDPSRKPVPVRVLYSPRNPSFCIIVDSKESAIGIFLRFSFLLLATVTFFGGMILSMNLSDATKRRWRHKRFLSIFVPDRWVCR